MSTQAAQQKNKVHRERVVCVLWWRHAGKVTLVWYRGFTEGWSCYWVFRFINAVTKLSAGDNFADFILLLRINHGLMSEQIKQPWSNQVRKCIKFISAWSIILLIVHAVFRQSCVTNYKTKGKRICVACVCVAFSSRLNYIHVNQRVFWQPAEEGGAQTGWHFSMEFAGTRHRRLLEIPAIGKERRAPSEGNEKVFLGGATFNRS